LDYYSGVGSKVPDSSIPRYTQKEIEVLKGVSLEEVTTLHQAKEMFKGEIDN
jgi:hypothetical protein